MIGEFSFKLYGYQYNLESSSEGVFYQQSGYPSRMVAFESGESNAGTLVKMDASRSNAIYGNSLTVQPNALTCQYLIRY